MGVEKSTRLEALLLVAAKLARADSRGDAINIATVGGVAALGGTGGGFAEVIQAAPARYVQPRGRRLRAVTVRMRDEPCGTLTAELPDDETTATLFDSLAELLGAALEREARVGKLARELGQAGEAQRFLAQASESLALSLDDKTTLNVLAHLAVPYIADWCVVDASTREGAVSRVAVASSKERSTSTRADAELAASLLQSPPPRGVIGPESREVLSVDLTRDGDLPSDLVPVARATGALSAVVVYAFGAADGIVRIALFSARSERRMGFDEFALAEELARRTSHALERAVLYGEAQRANEAKDVFLATVSHELRGPLAAVSMWTHVLGLKKTDEGTRVRAVQAIDESVRALGRLIEDMIDLSRLVGGKLQLNVARISVGAAVRAAVEQARPAARAKGVTVVLNEATDATIEGDSRRLAQALRNVVSNAIEFTPSGQKVEVAMSRLPEGVKIDVRDEGEGIGADFLPHVFKPFRQEDASLTRARGGLGLGLAVARRIVELHGGTIRAESEGRGTGATFTIELPLSP